MNYLADPAPGFYADATIVVVLIIALYTGWRQGAFASILSTVGVVAGLICGVALAPFAMQLTDHVALRFLLALATMAMLVGIGNLTGGVLGTRLRSHMRWRSSLRLDSGIGAIFQAFTVLIVTWLVAIPLVTALPGNIAHQVRNSKILSAVDHRAPQQLAMLPSKVSAMLSESGLPPLVSPFLNPDNVTVEAPALLVEDTALVEALRPSVVHLSSTADSCARRLMGSGFVVDSNHVITNAHVVAGANSVNLDTLVGTYPATVVYYNPQLDIAVLESPDMNIEPLKWAEESALSGDDAISMGFPESGPFEAAPARVNNRLTITGFDIYADQRVEREAYTVRGSIRQGYSGGPMINTRGEVIGVIFGASSDESDIGYVLSAREVREAVGDLSVLSTPVGTGECVLR
ncbi:MarP family serine protease [Corynebacterium sp. ES2794-CONJ1]|uniref:MarP family serine protease n=1 Tax=unclassified Corynebacterium TaxID=2624378 RepID=UPI00216A525D|nr:MULTISPECIES: MarP family serine protease [unclassified Corynebacterium]MCS4490097.1 MarP family serine protease [Corynebacterium sp. ES2775-CONJ]MCS4492094.1 MarP family serine protease [Corynebacterium sp. ES2715-CONJ3]MCS4532202.1 MarP family serine protease [Corynebacterium sp. ES2730-CONJ]MCU9519598.1 MarP family serine protease [Corynebacterium sp. ES2794-CONJ1]